MEMMRMHPTCLRDKTLINVPESIPMQMLNEGWAYRNHGQTLKRLNERGGLGILELLDNIHQRRLTHSEEIQEHVDELNNLIKAHKKL